MRVYMIFFILFLFYFIILFYFILFFVSGRNIQQEGAMAVLHSLWGVTSLPSVTLAIPSCTAFFSVLGQ